MRQIDAPEDYRGYPCDDYFGEGWWVRGHFDDFSQTLVIAPLAEAYEDRTIGFFAVGRSGWGRVDFGYRKDHPGLWAFYVTESRPLNLGEQNTIRVRHGECVTLDLPGTVVIDVDNVGRFMGIELLGYSAVFKLLGATGE